MLDITAMRTGLEHLPPAKQRELEQVVRILFEEFASATSIATADWKRQARILKVPCMVPTVVRQLGRPAPYSQGLAVNSSHVREAEGGVRSWPVAPM